MTIHVNEESAVRYSMSSEISYVPGLDNVPQLPTGVCSLAPTTAVMPPKASNASTKAAQTPANAIGSFMSVSLLSMSARHRRKLKSQWNPFGCDYIRERKGSIPKNVCAVNIPNPTVPNDT